VSKNFDSDSKKWENPKQVTIDSMFWLLKTVLTEAINSWRELLRTFARTFTQSSWMTRFGHKIWCHKLLMELKIVWHKSCKRWEIWPKKLKRPIPGADNSPEEWGQRIRSIPAKYFSEAFLTTWLILTFTFAQFGHIQIQWPGKDIKSAIDGAAANKAGYVYIIFEFITNKNLIDYRYQTWKTITNININWSQTLQTHHIFIKHIVLH
jgi:hypothetical protein